MSTHNKFRQRPKSHAELKKQQQGGAVTANAKRFHARMKMRDQNEARQNRQDYAEEDDEDDDQDEEMQEDEDEDDSFTPTTVPNRLTLDMIATSTSHSANKAKAAPQRTPKNTPRPEVSHKRKRVEEDEEDNDEDAIPTTSATFRPTPSPPVPAASSESTAHIPQPAFAPAATAVGALFSSITPSLDKDILTVLQQSFGFTRMTPVQQQTIPTFLKKDVAVQSYTGSGKTLSFVLPMLQILLTKFSDVDGEINIEPHTVAAIILSPTRELATQICSVIAPFVFGGEHASKRLQKFRLAHFIGGSTMSSVELDFVKNGGNIIVATPGRLNSTMGKLQAFQTKELRVLILDEADRLLDEGFEQDLTDILRKLPKQRRTGLFSATQTRQVKELRRAGLQEKFAKIDVLLEWKKKKEDGSQTNETTGRTQMTPTTLQNFYTIVKTENKFSLLIDFITKHAQDKIIIFFLTGDQVEYYHRILLRLRAIYSRNLHKKIHALRGGKQGMDQNKRTAQFQAFVKEDNGGILLATDVAARGIDVPDVDWIIQFDPPKDPSVFVHRIGRTARMGKSGSAIVYLTPEERPYVDLIQNLNVPISLKSVPDDAFEAHHSWKTDPDIGEIVKAMEEGKSASQVMESIRKKHQKAQQSEKKMKEEPQDPNSEIVTPGSIRSVLKEVKYLCLEDRFLMDKAQRAYTSFIDGYKQHVMTHALNYQKLPFGDVALGMGLLYLPKMPDIKHLTASIRYDRVPIKAHLVKFKDAKLQEEHDKKEALIHEKNQQEQADREKKYKERQKKLLAAGPKRKKKMSQLIRDEWDELQNENRLLKKLKQGKISKKEFEIAVGERKKNGQEKSNLSEDDSDAEFDEEDEDDSDGDDDGAKQPKKKAKTTNESNRKKQKSDEDSMSDVSYSDEE